MGLGQRLAAPFLRPFRRAARDVAFVPSSGGLIPPLGSIQSASGLLISAATSLTVGAVYRAVHVRSHDVARCRPSLWSEDEQGNRRKIGRDEHALAALMIRPNRVQTWFEFMRDMMVAYLLRGNAYAVILRDKRGEPKELLWVNPDAVMVLEAANGEFFYQVNRIGLFQMAMLRDQPLAIPSEDMLHFRGISFNMLVAASTIGLARDSVGLAMAQSQMQSRWVGNGARPSVILESPGQLSESAAKRLKQNWQDYAAGLSNVGTTAVLENGIKAQKLALTSVDLEFVAQCSMTIQDIGRFFGVPNRKLQLPDLSRGSTIIQEDQSYVNETVSPDLEMIEQRLELVFDLGNEGYGVDLDESPLLRADPKTRYDIGRIGVLSGLITPNEWRRAERLDPKPNGDELMHPANLAALGSDLTGTAPDAAGRPPAGKEPKPKVPNVTPDSPTGGGDTALEGAHEPEMQRLADRAKARGDKVTPLHLTVNVDARAGGTTKRRGKLKKNEDGTVGIEMTESAEPEAAD